MSSNTGHVLTLANSIIGVSVLAMPFCFKQCGIALSILLLLFSSIISRLSCHYLIKSAIMERMKNFEMLAFRAFGHTGKMMVELCIIGFMLGTCVAFFVIMGDLGPTILGPIFGMEHPTALRPSVLIGAAVFVVLPLGLLRNVDSLSAICAASIAFYLCLVLKVIVEAGGNLITGSWLHQVIWWRPSGILQCIPIFSMALSCQTQLFEIFDSLPNTQIERTNAVVRMAINMTTLFYIAVGFFGYTAYCNQAFTGNLMMNFSPTLVSEIIKLGFILSIAVSFPLVIFPCRASIYSLFFSKIQHGYEGLGSSHIPETKFQCITLVIVTLSLVIGLLIPQIEVILGLVGSTIGVFVCVIVPGMIFNNLSSRKNNEKLVAQLLVAMGFVIMVLGTYANLFATEKAMSGSEPKLKIVDENANMELASDISYKKEQIEKAIEKLEQKEEIAGPVEIKAAVKVQAEQPIDPKKTSDEKIPKSLPEAKLSPVEIQPVNNALPLKDSISEPVKSIAKVIQPEAQRLPNVQAEKTNFQGPLLHDSIKNEQNALLPVINNISPESQINSAQSQKEKESFKILDSNPSISKKIPEPIQEKVKLAVADNVLSDEKGEERPPVNWLEKPVNLSALPKEQVKSRTDEKKKSSNKDNLSLSMAQGLPIPLAIKGMEKSNKENNPPAREILSKLEREKRDTEAAIQQDNIKQNKSESFVNENCPKTTVKPKNIPPAPDSLIKSPKRLTGESILLDKQPDLKEPPPLNRAAVKRELKSLMDQVQISKQKK